MNPKSTRARWLAPVALLALCVGAEPARSQSEPCADSTEPLLSFLTAWAARRAPQLDPEFSVFASGAALAVAYDTRTGFHIPDAHRLLWPGRILSLFDSTYVPERPATFRDAHDRLLAHTADGRRVLLLASSPLEVYGVDTSLGEPWFFVVECTGAMPDSAIWDAADLRRRWWRWTDLPGANTMWPETPAGAPKVGRRLILGGIRNLVLAARPDTVSGRPTGLAALQSALGHEGASPGPPARLAALSGLRQKASDYLAGAADLWAPANREPIKLAAFYLKKDAEAWRTLAAVSAGWSSYGPEQRREWLSAVSEWETRAAVALDELVSAAE